MNCDTPTTQRTQTQKQTQDRYVSVTTGVLSYSINIHLFSQNQSLLSPISNQIIIIKRLERIKLNNDFADSNGNGNGNGNDLMTVKVEDKKDGYYK